MSYFVMPYQIHFHDTMAYGSHHHITNIKFQNTARETLFFESKVDGEKIFQEQFKDIVLLTREAYSMNMAPVRLGESVAILLTFEDPSRSTVRLCFRVVKFDGSPVSCGYQTMVCMHKNTFALIPAPTLLRQYVDENDRKSIREKLVNPSFLELIRSGSKGIKKIFSPEVISIGKYIANAPLENSYPRIIDELHNEYRIGDGKRISADDAQISSAMSARLVLHKSGIHKKPNNLFPVEDAASNWMNASPHSKRLPPLFGEKTGKTAFIFPGQGAYDPAILRNLYVSYPETAPFFHLANDLALHFLGKEFLPLITGSSQHGHDLLLRARPDLDQLGIFLANVLIGKILLRHMKPNLMLGHSFGEFSALAMSGVYSIEQGLEMVCHRILALQSIGNIGKMVAACCGYHQLNQILKKADTSSVTISVINHPSQTVISGTPPELKKVEKILKQHGIAIAMLKSNYPFHSFLLARAVKVFQKSLESYDFKPPSIPVFLCTERKFYTPDCDLAEILAIQFIRRLNFESIIHSTYKDGCRIFIECGPGKMIGKIVQKILADKTDINVLSVTDPGKGLKNAEDLAEEISVGNNWVEKPVILSPPRKRDIPATEAETAIIPAAVVSYGCVLPGADNPEQFWRNVKQGIGGIVDLSEIYPDMKRDFMSQSDSEKIKIVSDKTYTLINGSVLEVSYDPGLLSSIYSEDTFKRLTKGQKMLALATAQSMKGYRRGINAHLADKTLCILGSTADGSREYDEALFLESLHAVLQKLDEPRSVKNSFSKILEKLSGYQSGDARQLEQYKLYSKVIQQVTGRNMRTFLIDTACSSSLYCVDVGIKLLQRLEADVIVAGGVFAPGPANNTLFAQFRGLAHKHCRPLDAAADGTVFGEGAGIVILKRLSDAMTDGDPIHSVIRGVGLSSDGKSPSINVPNVQGQTIAIKRAYENAKVDMNTIQYIEAHATGTPMGDEIECKALAKAMGKRAPSLPPVEIGSVKSLIGHTGWLSGAASIIKICKAFEEKLIPGQHGYDAPNPKIGLDGAPFIISKSSHPWADNIDFYPRRAGINSFGFGGTNAHLIMEAFDKDYHTALCDQIQTRPYKSETLAIIGTGAVFPEAPNNGRRFDRKTLGLPANTRILPDVIDHMDASQFLSSVAAEKILTSLPDDWRRFKNDIAVILGLESKTERSVRANERIFIDRLKRVFLDNMDRLDARPADMNRILDKIIENIKKDTIPSGPYTLPGLMPNVTASRIVSLFDIKGPNMVIDMGGNSFFQALITAEHYLVHNDYSIVLAGGVNAFGGNDGTNAEAAVLLALTTQETARKNKLPIICTLKISDLKNQDTDVIYLSEQAPGINYRGAHGAVEVLDSIQRAHHRNSTSIIKERELDFNPHKKIVISPDASYKSLTQITAPTTVSARTYAYVQETPIYYYTPSLFPLPAQKDRSVPLKEKKILFLTDDPDGWEMLENTGALDMFTYQLVSPPGGRLKNAVIMKTDSDESIGNSLSGLKTGSYDLIIALKDLSQYQERSLLVNNTKDELVFMDLLFALCRHSYEQIKNKEISTIVLCMGAFRKQHLDPYTGLASGFLKSLSRELPGSNCRMVNTSETSFHKALHQVEIELGQEVSGPVMEICYKDNRRHVVELTPLKELAKDAAPCLHSDSVVIATGGGRGVTAVLVEELLQRFGCTVIALGRTDISSAPKEIRNMDEQAFRDFEPRFYKEALLKDKTQKITDLKRRYASYQAANELSRVIKKMRALPGRYEYVSVDINNEEAVHKLVDTIHEKYGRLDMIIHGAGIQISKVLTKKSVQDFNQIILTKLGSLRHLYRACEKTQDRLPVHFHVLTSAFSYMGNDGQPDYGAANEAMNRIAAVMSTTTSDAHWSTLAWLGWEGIGMTRGSEFAALAASRRLRGVTRKEGQRIFSSLMAGTPTTPINILLADGEIDYYDVRIKQRPDLVSDNTKKTMKLHSCDTMQWNISTDNAPFLLDHLVNKVPTIPGALIISLVANTVHRIRPDLRTTAFEDANFHKFIKVFKNKDTQIRVNTLVLSENEDHAVIRVRILSDFTHKSGIVLQKDIEHFDTIVQMSGNHHRPSPKPVEPDHQNARRLPDPYIFKGSPVQLGGQFDGMSNIMVSKNHRSASFQLTQPSNMDSEYMRMLPQMILMDCLFRFSAITISGNNGGSFPIYVPEKCGKMKVFFNFEDDHRNAVMNKMIFTGVNPRENEDTVSIGPVEARDLDGHLIILIEDGVCRKVGEIKNNTG